MVLPTIPNLLLSSLRSIQVEASSVRIAVQFVCVLNSFFSFSLPLLYVSVFRRVVGQLALVRICTTDVGPALGAGASLYASLSRATRGLHFCIVE